MNAMTIIIPIAFLSPFRLRNLRLVLQLVSKLDVPVLVVEQYRNIEELDPVDTILKQINSPNIRHLGVFRREDTIWKTALMNEGARVADSQALWFLDADIVMNYKAVLQAYSGQDLFHPFEYVIHLNEPQTIQFIELRKLRVGAESRGLSMRPPPGPHSIIMSKALFDKIGGADERFGFGYEDLDLVLRAMKHTLPDGAEGIAVHLNHDRHVYDNSAGDQRMGKSPFVRPEAGQLIHEIYGIDPVHWGQDVWGIIEKLRRERKAKGGVHYKPAKNPIRKADTMLKNPIPPKQIPKVPPPTVAEMMSNFSHAMVRWAKSGFKLVDEQTYRQRITICRGCPLWDEQARMGAGKCKHHKCGCTKTKHWLATEKCPLGKWNAVEK